MKRIRLVLCLILALATVLAFQPARADTGPVHTLVPIGSDYHSDTLQLFARAAAQRDTNGTVDLLVIPATYGTDAYSTTNGERQKNLSLADNRRNQIEAACNAVKSAGQACRAVLAQVLIRPDSYLQSNLDLFVPDLDGMYVLGGDQTIGMQVLANTPFETAMGNAFAAGAVLSGNSAGAAVQSRNMINGYVGNNGPENGFQQGSVDLWLYGGPTDDTRGLYFGISNAIFEQHAFQRGRIARLINTAFTTGLPGIALDAETGATIVDESTLGNVTGTTAAFIVDLQTFGATGRFGGPTSSLAVHNVTTHVIPPGSFGYDITHSRPTVDGRPLPAPTITGRSFDALRLPAGYGPLLLGGDLSGDRSGLAAQRFVSLSGGAASRLVVLAIGYARNTDAQADAKAWASALQSQGTTPVQWYVVDPKVNKAAIVSALGSSTGVLVTAPDQSLVLSAFTGAPEITAAIQNAWA
ncbi:MAG: Type 1 glutamine amidotransferase-like domain-containing protein, partial [Anaerolineae bacterium]